MIDKLLSKVTLSLEPFSVEELEALGEGIEEVFGEDVAEEVIQLLVNMKTTNRRIENLRPYSPEEEKDADFKKTTLLQKMAICYCCAALSEDKQNTKLLQDARRHTLRAWTAMEKFKIRHRVPPRMKP